MVTGPSTEMTKGYIDLLLSFQIFQISTAKFSYSFVFSASAVGRLLWVKGTAIMYYKCCFIQPINEHYIRYVKNLPFYQLR